MEVMKVVKVSSESCWSRGIGGNIMILKQTTITFKSMGEDMSSNLQAISKLLQRSLLLLKSY